MFGFQVLGIQIVTVFWIKLLVNCQLVRSCFVIADLGWYAYFLLKFDLQARLQELS